MTTVEEIMTQEVLSCRGGDSLEAVLQIMWEHDFGCLPVVDEHCRVVGMITDRDAAVAAYTQGKRLSEILVSSACAHLVFSCGPREPLSHAETTMAYAQVRRLPVVAADGVLLGMLSLNDIVRYITMTGPELSSSLNPHRLAQLLRAITAPRNPVERCEPDVPASATVPIQMS